MRVKLATLCLVLGSSFLLSNIAGAEPTKCASAYEHAQELRAERRLRDALGALKDCIDPSCPEFVRTECSRWLDEVETSMPSVVLSAQKDGKESQSVRVLIDDAPLAERLDGRSIVVDPGPHTLTFVAQNEKPIQLQLVFREGEKNRLVTVTFGQADAPKPSAVEPVQPVRSEPSSPNWLAYGLGGVGLLGVGGFIAFGLWGNSELSDKEHSCAPACSDSEVSSIRTKYHLADISLGVGVVSLGVAGYLLLSSPKAEAQRATTSSAPNLDVGLLHHGGYAVMRTRF
jgi:hypothetical protein